MGNNTKGKEKLDMFVGDIPPSNANMSSVSAGSPAVSVWTSPAGSSDMNGPSADEPIFTMFVNGLACGLLTLGCYTMGQ